LWLRSLLGGVGVMFVFWFVFGGVFCVLGGGGGIRGPIKAGISGPMRERETGLRGTRRGRARRSEGGREKRNQEKEEAES